jgi:hypothetical protein
VAAATTATFGAEAMRSSGPCPDRAGRPIVLLQRLDIGRQSSARGSQLTLSGGNFEQWGDEFRLGLDVTIADVPNLPLIEHYRSARKWLILGTQKNSLHSLGSRTARAAASPNRRDNAFRILPADYGRLAVFPGDGGTLPQFDRRTSRSTPTTAAGIYGKRKLKTPARATPPIVNSSRYSATCQPTSWVRWPRSRAMIVRQNVHTA